jgi:HNH endonuclease
MADWSRGRHVETGNGRYARSGGQEYDMISELRPYQLQALQDIRDSVLTHERLKQVLEYDPETGIFRWLQNMGSNKCKGMVAGAVKSTDGYRQISIDGISYYAHCLAWFFVHGKWPVVRADHKNLARDDNRIENLRESTDTENSRNRGLRVDNKLGVKGVHRRENGKYRASIRVDGKLICLGSFVLIEDAANAYAVAAQRYFGEFARLS